MAVKTEARIAGDASCSSFEKPRYPSVAAPSPHIAQHAKPDLLTLLEDLAQPWSVRHLYRDERRSSLVYAEHPLQNTGC